MNLPEDQLCSQLHLNTGDEKMKKRAVVFAPHPDDETLGCGGTIAKKLNEGYYVSVVFMTDGRYSLSEIGMSAASTPFEMKAIRREEAAHAMKILGLQEKNLLFLDFEDKTLEKNERTVEKRVAEILTDASPIEVFFPQAKEYNIDHRVTNRIVRRAIEKSRVNSTEFQYVIAWKFPFYLLARFSHGCTFDALLSKVQENDLVCIDISEFLQLKKMAIKEYKSQTEVLSSEQKRPVLKSSFLKRFLGSKERFFVRNPKS
jgi:LmbE family N-acetylglucosaminyl deacetylase